MKRAKRWMAIGITAAFVAAGAEMVTPVTASAAQVDLVCQGITGDVASPTLGDSAKVLGLLASLGGGGSGLTFSADITTNAPAKVSPNAGPFDATFNLTMTLPPSLVKQAKETLKLSSVEVRDATYAIQATGASDSNISVSVPSQVVDLNANPVVLSQTISGKIDPKKAGTIGYRPGGNTRLSIVVNTTVAGIQINSLTVTCGSTRDVAQTAVQIPGSPNVSQPIIQGAYTASIVGRPLMGQHITPDDGNPIIDGSLRLVSQSPVGGYSAVGGGAAFFLAPQEPGLYWVDYEVCANSRLVPTVPGVNTVQSLTFPENYQGKGLNAHPLSMKLSFKGAETAAISLSSFLGQPSATVEQLATNVDRFFAQFTAPSAATIRAALEKLPTVGAGNVQVTGPTNGAYTITFVGALGKSDQPLVTVTGWETWLPSSLLDTALGALNPPVDPNAPTTTTAAPETIESLDAKLAAGQITVQQYIDGRLVLLRGEIVGGLTTPAAITALTSLFPKTPDTALVTAGSPEVPAYQTGPLCTPFQIGYWTVPNPARVLAATQTRTVTKCTTKRVKVKGKYVKKRSCRKVRVTR